MRAIRGVCLAIVVASLVLTGCSGGAGGSSHAPPATTAVTPTASPTMSRSDLVDYVGGPCGFLVSVEVNFAEFATNPSRENRRLVLQTVVLNLQRMHQAFAEERDMVPPDMVADYRTDLLHPSGRLVTAGQEIATAFRDRSSAEAAIALRRYAAALAWIVKFGEKYRIPNCAQRTMPELPVD